MNLYILFAAVYLFFCGCSANTSKKMAALNTKKLDTIGQLSYGVDYSLDRTNIPAAKALNAQVLNITGLPTVEKQTLMTNAVEHTNFIYITKEIVKIEKIENAINEQLKKDSENLQVVQTELNAHKKWFGLGGVVLGLKRFCYWMVGFGVLFLILRVLSTANPIASAAFSIFEGMGAMFIRGVGYIVPKALTMTKTAGEQALRKVVDVVESNNLLNDETKSHLSDKMTPEEKELIKKIKAELLY